MPDNQQDMLSQSLQRLENELTLFGTVQNALKEAREKLINAEKEWDRLTKEQQQSALQLVSATKSAINATNVVTSQSKELAESLIPLAKAIETVNFPMRLDKIDMAVSTQASTLASFQGVFERGFRDLHVEMEKGGKCVSDGFNSVNTAMGKASKRGIMITVLLVINTVIVIGLAVLFYTRGNASYG